MKKSELRQIIQEEIKNLNENSIENEISKIISKAPKHNQKHLKWIKNASLGDLSKWVKMDQQQLNKKYKGNLLKLKRDLIKQWSNASNSSDEWDGDTAAKYY